MTQKNMRIALKKLRMLKRFITILLAHENTIPGICWAVFPIEHAIDAAISEIDFHLQYQAQLLEEAREAS